MVPDPAGPYFHLDQAGDGVVFIANAGGVTTSGSSCPRSEVREMDGDRKADWSNRAGTHTLSVRQAVTRLPAVKPDVVTAQIHDAEDDVLEVRLEGERLVAQYEDGDGERVIDPVCRLGTRTNSGSWRRGAACRSSTTASSRPTSRRRGGRPLAAGGPLRVKFRPGSRVAGPSGAGRRPRTARCRKVFRSLMW
ncbi:polysaccharide lyase family 7 protein [Pseudonocardia xinjiangensis]|uniref:polysaccharide lyase family 7 protein n=1 Tax=Pseudonocardia xinjiangensis TaxID=75289 RepID=UPI003D93D0C9